MYLPLKLDSDHFHLALEPTRGDPPASEYAARWHDLPRDFKLNMLRGIVGLQASVEQLVVKFKSDQHRPEAHAQMFARYHPVRRRSRPWHGGCPTWALAPGPRPQRVHDMKSAWGVLSLLAALAVVALLAQRGLHAVGTTAGTEAGTAPPGQRAAQALEQAQTLREDVGRQLQEALQQREARSEPGQP